jgi:5-methylcytosine-specific restriction endonuclease McrA
VRFETSDRRSRLPKNWATIRRRILHRDKYCRGCHVNLATEVDHILPGDDHSDINLQGLCRYCHSRKSAREGGLATGVKRRAIVAARRRPEEPHPSGL